MSEAMQKAIAEYRRIQSLFWNGDPTAESEWEKFKDAENGWSLASGAIMEGVQIYA